MAEGQPPKCRRGLRKWWPLIGRSETRRASLHRVMKNRWPLKPSRKRYPGRLRLAKGALRRRASPARGWHWRKGTLFQDVAAYPSTSLQLDPWGEDVRVESSRSYLQVGDSVVKKPSDRWMGWRRRHTPVVTRQLLRQPERRLCCAIQRGMGG